MTPLDIPSATHIMTTEQDSTGTVMVIAGGRIGSGPQAGDFASLLLDESGAPAGMEALTKMVMDLTAKVDSLCRMIAPVEPPRDP